VRHGEARVVPMSRPAEDDAAVEEGAAVLVGIDEALGDPAADDVERCDRRNQILTTIEGNTSSKVRRKTYDLKRRSIRAKLDGFARPALGDFAPAEPR